jgi:hypothetical protein
MSRSSAGSAVPATASTTGGRAAVIGWEFVHVAVDDATLAYVEVLDDEQLAIRLASSAALSTLRRWVERCRRRLPLPRDCARARLSPLDQDLRTCPYRPRRTGKRALHPHLVEAGRMAVYRTTPSARRPRRLARLVQPAKTTPLTRPQATPQPARRDEQPGWDRHLALFSRCDGGQPSSN